MLQVSYMNLARRDYCDATHDLNLALYLLVIEIDLFYRKVSDSHSIRSHKNPIIGTTSKISLSLDST